MCVSMIKFCLSSKDKNKVGIKPIVIAKVRTYFYLKLDQIEPDQGSAIFQRQCASLVARLVLGDQVSVLSSYYISKSNYGGRGGSKKSAWSL